MREITVVIVAGLSFVLLGTLGGAIMKIRFLMPGYVMGPKMELLPLIYWLSWSCMIVGRFSGDFTCGVLLGRFLRRTNPVHVLFGFLTFPLGVIIVHQGFWYANGGLWVRSVGPAGAVAQLVLQVLAMAGGIRFGIWFGRRRQLDIDSRRHFAATSSSPVLTSPHQI